MTVCVLKSVRYSKLQKCSKQLQKSLRKFHKVVDSSSCTETLIKQHTELSRDHLTPEIALHLITRNCNVWYEKGDNSPFTDPYWAFYWPGGQALTRYILDNPSIFKRESVLDVGCGCGASAIATKMVGATTVVANDTDPVAITALNMNAIANGLSLESESCNLIGRLNSDWSTILLGDMFYDEIFRDSLVSWLTKQCAKYRTKVFIGDPGRLPLVSHPIKEHLIKVAEYELPLNCRLENNGLSAGYIWKFGNG